MNGLPFNPSAHYTGPIVISYQPPSNYEEPPNISITTSNYTLRPTTNEETVVTFYKDHILGNKNAMEGALTRTLDTVEEVRDKVDSFANRWRNGDHFSSFVVYDRVSGVPLAHTILGHGNAIGESDYSLLFRSEAPPKPADMDGVVPKYASSLIRTASCDNTGLETENFGLVVNKEELAREITYAMFQGWAPWLSKNEKNVMNDVTNILHPLSTIMGTVVSGNETHRALESMLESNGTNRMDSYTSSLGGTKWTHFFTTVREMQEMRRRLIDEGSSSSSPSESPPLAPHLATALHSQVQELNLNGSQSNGHSLGNTDIFEMED